MAELSLLTSGLHLGGTLVDFTSRLANSSGAYRAASANAAMMRRNAEAALTDAALARLSTYRRVEDIRRIGRARQGTLTAIAAARGVVTNEGSPLEAIAAEAYETGRVAGQAQYEGLLQERQLKIEALSREYQAKVIKAQAKYARKQAILGAIGGLALNVAGGLPLYAKGFAVAKSMLSPSPTTQGLSFQMPPGE